MDEDLKIVISSVLEADEDESAQRIAAQLPSISDKINSRGRLKIQLDLDQNKIQAQAQQVSHQISKAVKQPIGIEVSVNQGMIQKIQNELNSLGVDQNLTKSITAEMDKMGVRIDQISGAWRDCVDGEQRMLNLTIQGTDQLGRNLTIAKQFSYVTGDMQGQLEEQSSTITRITANLERQRNIEAQIAARTRAENESKIAFLERQKTMLSGIQSLYTGATSAKPVTNGLNLSVLEAKYAEIEQRIESMKAASGRMSQQQRADLEAEIARLRKLAKEYQNIEYVATKLRAKTVVQVNTEQVQKLAEYEEKLRSAGILTDDFEKQISGLRTQLNGAFDSKSLTAYLNGFDQLQSDVVSFQAKVKSVNTTFAELTSVQKQITDLQIKMGQVDRNSNEYAGLRQELALQLRYRKQISAEIGAQIAKNPALLQYASEYNKYLKSAAQNAARAATAEGTMADRAREVDAQMGAISASVQNIGARFATLNAPTTELTNRVAQLQTLLAAVSNAKTDQEKVSAFNRLQEAIAGCNREIGALLSVQRTGVMDAKFTSGLEKAKADLATVGRQWSALKYDKGLNAQFIQLGENLKRVQNQTDLTKWTAQFSAFKSQVKAAGLNMQTLGDIFKNNVGKVLQWVTATTMLFRAFRLLKSAISTVIALDTAMIDLRKTTNATEAEYAKFYKTANETAKALGATTEEVIAQTAEWSRLGYTLEEAAQLAKNSAIFAAVSPGMEQSMATDGLVSMIKAFGIDVNDTMDGIISKVNAVGNAFAVSNSDIVEAMTKSSAAMAAANNSFDETIALATAAIEITRDASSVGNGLKTLSMRIRGYDEETEEYSEDIAKLTGTIADLTKVASNQNRGVSLFEAGDPDTYRSTYDILADIADIWDELTDKNRASLLEALFGKRQAQIGAAILSNFDQARASIETMAKSAGSADKEMEKIYNSLEYKLNALKETWTGVTQSLVQTDDLKLVVEGLQYVSEKVQWLTEQLGLFGTAGLTIFLAGMVKLRSNLSAIQTAIAPVMQTLSGLTFDGTAASTLRYAAAISQLDLVQQKAALSALGLNSEQQKTILSTAAATAAVQKLTVAELAGKIGMEADEFAKLANAKATDQMTASMLAAAIASGQLNQAQMNAMMTTIQQTAANTAASGSFQTLGASVRMAGAAMMATPVGWVSLLLGALPVLITFASKLYDWVVVTAEEAYKGAEEAASAYAETTQEIEALNSELKTNKERLETLYRLSNAGTITLVEQDELDNLVLTNAELATTIARKKELAAIDAAKANAGYTESFGKTQFESNARDLMTAELDTIYERYSGLLDKLQDQANGEIVQWADRELEQASEVSNRIDEINRTLQNGYDQETGAWLDATVDYETHVRQLIDTYNTLSEKQKNGIALSTAERDLMQSTRNELVGLANDLDENYLSKYVGEDAQSQAWQGLLDLINQTIYATEYFGKKLTELPDDCYQQLQDLGSGAELTEEKVLELAAQFPALADWMEQSGYSAEETAAHFNALSAAQEEAGGTAVDFKEKLTDLKDTMSKTDDIYSLISTAQKEMYETGGVSAGTIGKLADVTDDYTQYLDEENGKLRININALKELAQAKVDSNVKPIQDEINALEKQNQLLQEKADYYLDQQKIGADGGIWNNLYADATKQIEENNRAIEENLDLLGQYQAIENPWSEFFGVFDAFTNSMEKLAEIQDAVSDGFTISAVKAREFAEVYPEILNAATASTDGQITLNADVVKAFLEGKEAELKGNVEAKVAELEAEKAVLAAKMDAAQAQLELAKSIGEGEGQIAKELAEYRINAGNAVAQAMIDAGIDEATAFKLAAEAMSQNAEEFDRVAMEVCTDVNGNFNEAAYNLAQTMYDNLTRVKQNLSDVAKQAHETAMAIAGVASGTVVGSTAIQGGAGGGVGGNGIQLDLTEGSFKGTEYSYEAKSSSLEDFVAKLELDISNYTEAIGKIDAQIAMLRSLSNSKISDYTSSSKKGSKGKEVEEYIATIDDYREALERLSRAQQQTAEIERKLDETENLQEKLLLRKQLIGSYQQEQEALLNLNRQRESTITAGAQALRELGFEVQYNAEANQLWISNLEHLNELTAESKGKYDSLQEATNALRKETEDLIDSITDLNSANQESTDDWKDLKKSIQDAREEIQNLLDEMVENASKAVDSIQDVYDALHQAADEYAESGWITVKTIQTLTDMGIQYLQYLMDENNQLVINEERIRDVIAARTEQLAIESSLAYIEALRIAQENEDAATLNNLLYATEEATGATWGLVYANLALLNLNGDQMQAALHNINALRAMAESAAQHIGQATGQVTEELKNMQSGVNDILEYVMDMLKQQIDDQVDALGEMKDAYSEIIGQRKEALQLANEEAKRQKTLASKMREIAKLQARIDALSLDDSREAQAEKAKLLEELNELQSDLADEQADRTLEAQEDALDKMEDAYHEEKDKEIEILKDSISSYQKLYDMAISYIESHWDTLYGELIDWNTQYGDVLNSEITTAWDNCLAAAQRYGSYVSALNNVGTDLENAQNSGGNTVVGEPIYENSSTAEESIHAIIKEMYANGQKWATADADTRNRLAERNRELGNMLAQYGVTAVRGTDGVWYVDRVGGERLFDKYRKYIYHEGGVVGGGDIKSNEQLALLKDKEWVLSEKMVDNFSRQMDRISKVCATIMGNPMMTGKTILPAPALTGGGSTINNVTNNNSNRPVEITIGGTVIHGADQSTVKQHIKVTEDMVNQIARIIGIRR